MTLNKDVQELSNIFFDNKEKFRDCDYENAYQILKKINTSLEENKRKLVPSQIEIVGLFSLHWFQIRFNSFIFFLTLKVLFYIFVSSWLDTNKINIYGYLNVLKCVDKLLFMYLAYMSTLEKLKKTSRNIMAHKKIIKMSPYFIFIILLGCYDLRNLFLFYDEKQDTANSWFCMHIYECKSGRNNLHISKYNHAFLYIIDIVHTFYFFFLFLLRIIMICNERQISRVI